MKQNLPTLPFPHIRLAGLIFELASLVRDGLQAERDGVIASGDRTEPLKLKVEVLDQMARAIELSVIVARRRPVGSQRAQITSPAAT